MADAAIRTNRFSDAMPAAQPQRWAPLWLFNFVTAISWSPSVAQRLTEAVSWLPSPLN